MFIFQPGEEGYDGAGLILREGVLEASGSRPVAAYGLHVSASLPNGVFRTRRGPLMAAGDGVRVAVQGRGGTAANVIPDDARFDVTVRSFSPESKKKVREGIIRVCSGIAAAHGLTVDVDYVEQYPVTVNDDTEAEFVADVVADVHGPERFTWAAQAATGSEDFSRVLAEVPGAFVFLGAGPTDRDPTTAAYNHSPLAEFDDSVLGGGAVLYSELALRRLARPDSRSLLVVGAGRISELLIEAHQAVLPIERVMVWARRPEQAQALAARCGGEAVDSIATGLAAADMVSAATLSEVPLICGADLRPGTHLDLVGAFRPTMRETDGEAVARSRVFIDTLSGVQAEAGDLIQAAAEGHFAWDDVVADMSELIAGTKPGRTSAGEITLFKSVGAAIEDLAAARLVAASGG